MAGNVAYCICKKIKTTGKMTMAYEHNYRIDHCENVDLSMSKFNEYLIALPEGVTYKDAFMKRLNESEYYKTHKPRKDAVLALDVQIPLGDPKKLSAEFDFNEWKRLSTQWLKDWFGEENVIAAVLHMDESVPHIHAMVVPINPETGQLSAKRYCDYEEQQNSIAAYMEPLGMKRGQRNSKVVPETMRDRASAVEQRRVERLPEPQQGETVSQYYARAQAAHTVARLQDISQIKDLQTQLGQARGKTIEAERALERERQEHREEQEKQKDALKRGEYYEAIMTAADLGLPDARTAASTVEGMRRMVELGTREMIRKKVGR